MSDKLASFFVVDDIDILIKSEKAAVFAGLAGRPEEV